MKTLNDIQVDFIKLENEISKYNKVISEDCRKNKCSLCFGCPFLKIYDHISNLKKDIEEYIL